MVRNQSKLKKYLQNIIYATFKVFLTRYTNKILFIFVFSYNLFSIKNLYWPTIKIFCTKTAKAINNKVEIPKMVLSRI